MKVVILHGTDASHSDNWFPWLESELKKLGHEVWVPDLPGAERPNMKCYTEFLLGSDWDFSDNVIIGHSSGSVAILGLLTALPEHTKINTGVLVGTFTERLSEDPSWEMLKELFDEPFDYEKVKARAKQFIVIHSDDDPYCPLDGAKVVADGLNASMKIFHGMGHFSKKLDTRFEKFPELLEILEQEVL
jgi:predicted alpha/beta hydrolase family esterase